MSEIKLKPCPFCGGEANMIQTYCEDTNYRGYHVLHSCSTFLNSIETSSYDTEKQAANSWNKRVGQEGGTECGKDINVPAKGKNDGWIPVEGRPPENDGFYIATLDGEICGEEQPFVGLAEFENGKWVDDEEDYRCILAWQPLPESYRPEPDTSTNRKERMRG